MLMRAVVDYQVFGVGPGGAPLDPKQWLDAVMKSGLEKSDFKGYSGEYFTSGPFELFYILFTIDMEIDDGNSPEDVREIFKYALEQILGEDDFSVRFISAA